jgi:signal transduction histidine kinase
MAGWKPLHPDDRAAWRDSIDRVFPTRQPVELEFRLRRADGGYGWMICSGRPYHDLQGHFAGYLCSCYDNTARRATEDALKESEERYQRITTNVPGMVFKLERATDQALRFTYVSQGSRAVTGLDPAAITADVNSLLDLTSVADRANLLATLDDSATHLTTWNWAGRLQPTHEATEKWITIRARPRRTEEDTTVWDGVVFDDTQSRLAQLELERSRERSLSRHLQTIREEEKARIAREVHDELGSTLTGLRIDLDWLIEHRSSVPEGVREKYSAMLALLEAAVAATRKIVTDLRPSILDDLGLASAMRWQIGEYRKHSDMTFDLQSPEPDIIVDRERALVLFRIFQETITNVTRYAKATAVQISLSQTDTAYVMRVRDDGVGITETDMRKPTSHGIRGMRERAEQLGGSLAVSGEPGDGTTVIVTVPKTPGT